MKAIWNAIRQHSRAAVVQSNYALPIERIFGNFDHKVPDSLYAGVSALNQEIDEGARERHDVFVNDGPAILLAINAAVLVWSAIGCHDFFTWALEVFPAVAGAAVLIRLYPRFRFTNMIYTLVALHAIILMIGGHYTYAEMPLFNWLRDTFHQSRNHYDRVGHFAQGFVPSLIAREVLLRITPLRRGKLLTWLILSSSMAISALYELIEFAVAMATGSSADAFLGTQGDVWDTQWDMTFCLIGTICALLLMSRLHDRALAQLKEGAASAPC